MATIFQTTFSNRFFLDENVWISVTISLKFVPEDQIKNIRALVQIMARHWLSDKPLSEPGMAYFTDDLNGLNIMLSEY